MSKYAVDTEIVVLSGSGRGLFPAEFTETFLSAGLIEKAGESQGKQVK